ncbi:uncharacterized protein BDR25DRAFT_304311 [Lindgomyces ingoldianus]|uniref:Uncharacterized protein n=1 Tax=Lindgomyces ingoldianus TaxID=673940 RepID=A0ACB6QRA1_9PLEO|nr:uncharacterized protein BDR25DRAFT_304311 [Lindgomyces ingoldianus]KAF2469533.1 hypothetical protein BDR25DRAFT_304311 [Lindgomyces ingoldianus]
MGEKFDVNQETGKGSVSIPIGVPPGRAGMDPKLSLTYNSGAGNGEFGLGWSLQGRGIISRKTSKGLEGLTCLRNRVARATEISVPLIT